MDIAITDVYGLVNREIRRRLRVVTEELIGTGIGSRVRHTQMELRRPEGGDAFVLKSGAQRLDASGGESCFVYRWVGTALEYRVSGRGDPLCKK